MEGVWARTHIGEGTQQQALGTPAGQCTCPGPGTRQGSGKPSLPAGTVLRQTPQNGLQVLLVGADLGEVTLEALDLQLLLLRLLLQQPQFPLQGPGRAQLQPQVLQCPLGVVQGLAWGSVSVQRPFRGAESYSVSQFPAGPRSELNPHPETVLRPNLPGFCLPVIHQERKLPKGRCSEVGKDPVCLSHQTQMQTLELSPWVAMGNCSFLLFVLLL